MPRENARFMCEGGVRQDQYTARPRILSGIETRFLSWFLSFVKFCSDFRVGNLKNQN